MAEQTLNDPLCGEEIKAIILQRIKNSLDRDSNLLNDIAYAGFKAAFEINLSFVRSLAKPTLIWGNVEGKTETDGPTEESALVMSGEYKTEKPDIARQAHDLPVPVMAQTPSGLERRKVKIQKKEGGWRLP